MNNRFKTLAFAFLIGGCAAPKPAVAPIPIPESVRPVAVTPVVAVAPAHCEQVRDGNKIARIQSEVDPLLARLHSGPTFA